MIYEIELFTQDHYLKSIEPDENLCDLFRDLFLFHWKEEAHHAVMDGLEWPREDAKLTDDERDRAVDDLIELVGAVDGILQEQSRADAEYFLKTDGRSFGDEEAERIKDGLLKAYRRQYIFSGVEHPRFREQLAKLIDAAQAQRLKEAFEPLMG